ncbi:MAG TPA: DUF1156 domain-containing protein, partial [Candidatus Binatia bacterium]|nr:DUF1156 domain-containing protein [Candidatus Binatia bacterium]
YLPIQAISAEAQMESSVTQAKGYLSKALLSILHRWWARRPLVACRAAVYAALVPADQFRPANGPEEKRTSLARANAAKFLERLCRREVLRKDLEAAAAQIREENDGRAVRVLDQFAGGGSIPLEATRLGCEAHALELNPVAHLVEQATLVYPAKYGTELSCEVRRWSRVVLERAKAEVGNLYPSFPDPKAGSTMGREDRQGRLRGMEHENLNILAGHLNPAAYLWTRTVFCKNCSAVVPLHRQTWLRKKAGGFIALRPVATGPEKRVRYKILESAARNIKQAVTSWGFDPTDLSKAGEAECLFCRSAVTTDHVKECGKTGQMGMQLMAVVATCKGERGKVYLPAGTLPQMEPDEMEVEQRLDSLLKETGLSLPTEPIFI